MCMGAGIGSDLRDRLCRACHMHTHLANFTDQTDHRVLTDPPPVASTDRYRCERENDSRGIDVTEWDWHRALCKTKRGERQ